MSGFRSPVADIKRRLREDIAAAKADARGAINDTARAVEAALYQEERAVFDRPVPYTVPPFGVAGNGSIRTEYAGQGSGTAAVMVRGRGQVPGSAIPHESYLRAQILGGRRRLKRLEVALQRAGLMPAGWFAIPAAGARRDAYGNLSGGQAVQLISYFQAFGAGAARANMSDKRRALLAKDRNRKVKAPPSFVPGVGFVDSGGRSRKLVRGAQFFVVPGPGRTGGLVPGVWERQGFGQLGQGVRPVLIFVSSAQYSPLFNFYSVADRTARTAMPRYVAQRRAEARRRGRP